MRATKDPYSRRARAICLGSAPGLGSRLLPTPIGVAHNNDLATNYARILTAIDRRLQERERLLREAELAQNERDAATRRVVQRTVPGFLASLLLSLATGAFAIYALKQKNEAGAHKKNAEGQARNAENRKRKTEKPRQQAQITESGLLAHTVSKHLDERGFGDAGPFCRCAQCAVQPRWQR